MQLLLLAVAKCNDNFLTQLLTFHNRTYICKKCIQVYFKFVFKTISAVLHFLIWDGSWHELSLEIGVTQRTLQWRYGPGSPSNENTCPSTRDTFYVRKVRNSVLCTVKGTGRLILYCQCGEEANGCKAGCEKDAQDERTTPSGMQSHGCSKPCVLETTRGGGHIPVKVGSESSEAGTPEQQ